MADARTPASPADGKVIVPPEFMPFLDRTLAESTRSARITGLLMLDLGRSDRLSALTGHPDSERVLKSILHQLDSLLRPHDRVAVVSNDEVWIVLPEIPHHQLAVIVATRIVDTIDYHGDNAAGNIQLRPRIGIACFPEHAVDARRLLEAADDARCSAISTGERYAIYHPSRGLSLPDARFTADLNRAIKDNELELHYQPQIHLRSGECRSAEALIRWTRANGESVPASRIAEAAELGDAPHALAFFVFNTALRHVLGFQGGHPALRLSVNVSAKLVGDRELPTLVGELLDAWSVLASQLTIEVTESSIVKDIRRSADILGQVKSLGVRLAMDDFGTGYSSLAHLKLLPFDELKIDQLFVRNLASSRGDHQIVRAMINLGHDFGMEIVAEGVEDRPTLDCLRELGCDVAQGHLIGKPMTMEAFAKWRADYHATTGVSRAGIP